MHFTFFTALLVLDPLVSSVLAVAPDVNADSVSSPNIPIKRAVLDARDPDPKKGRGSSSHKSGNNNNNNDDDCNQGEIALASSSLSSLAASLTSSLTQIPFATPTLPGVPFPTIANLQAVSTLFPDAQGAYKGYTELLSQYTGRTSSCAGQVSQATSTGTASATQTTAPATSSVVTSAATAVSTTPTTDAAACLNAGLGLVGGAVAAVVMVM